MLTVREAMKTGGLSKCRLLAGEAGLDNAITCVDCMEVPNIEPWLPLTVDRNQRISCVLMILYFMYSNKVGKR